MKILKIIIFIFIICLTPLRAHIADEAIAMLFNSPISYQHGFGLDNHPYRSSFDANINYIILNFAYNYNPEFKSTLFVGLGLGSFLQVQYGYAFSNDKNLIRVRSDIPLYLPFRHTNSLLKYINIGIYYENSFNDIERSNSIGLTFGVSLASFIIKK